MHSKRIASAVTLLAVVILSGCSGSLLESKKIDYKSAGKLPPLEIPPDLTAPSRDERYTVPDINPKGTATYSAYSVERGGQARSTTAQDVLPQMESMRIERGGTQRWLVVPGSPEKLWPVVKEFWQELGFIVNIEMPDAGIMETDWAAVSKRDRTARRRRSISATAACTRPTSTRRGAKRAGSRGLPIPKSKPR